MENKLLKGDTLIINGKPIGSFLPEDVLADFDYWSNEGNFNRYHFEVCCFKDSRNDEMLKEFLKDKKKYKLEIIIKENK